LVGQRVHLFFRKMPRLFEQPHGSFNGKLIYVQLPMMRDLGQSFHVLVLSFSPFPLFSPSMSPTSASSNAIECRMKSQEISQTNGKNITPRRNHVSVKPKTRVAISSGKK